ncbi:ATP-dependent DNA helicase [Ectobacillus antri]|jgi:ATP-dependent DNA helicase DinG|uniref:ATP-dependent DNA helicase n=1 Tax=Ectobacillus antri TaxID=2486280 RepID=A0ABT6H0R6_9BACI|nr:ATP-dependent DNA helicase [Ectobacillus antri]MDG4656147.1 ATP-dependent DNA helicase [Ectobacillus antri]MDG5752822.1 ATP-dependent DNA helicase [Ectobacillus antri]
MVIREKLPFEVGKQDNFYEKLNEWIGDVFYDILPEAGFELRDEQIFMAFQLDRAFREKKVMFAEAGVGTGKTIVYLLYAICYARYTGKPAIIACADETLIEQLVKEEGDIAKLSRALSLNIDVRLAKSMENYLCLKKIEGVMEGLPSEAIEDAYDTLPEFVFDHGTLQTFEPYGDRKEYPLLNDEEWSQVSFDYFQDCSTCDKRHRCGQTLSRDYYRKATDLVICSQDFFMEHVWTFEARKREGQIPLLPEGSCVIFDEGHLVEYAAQKALTYRLKETMMEDLLTRLLQNDVRQEFAELIEDAIAQASDFFYTLKQHTNVTDSHRLEIARTDNLIREAKRLYKKVEEIGDALVFESELYTVDQYDLNIVDEHLDMLEHSLKLFIHEDKVISWAEESEGALTLIVMPRAVEEVLREKVFAKHIPYIFSSATLSENASFDFMAKTMGVTDYLSFSVASPFDYEQQMKVYLRNDETVAEKVSYAVREIEKIKGRTLILFRTKEELQRFKQEVDQHNVAVPFLYEGDQEISQLVSRFQKEEETVLCAVHLWEGLDIPGSSLSHVIIWSLPYPPNDPVFEAKRSSVANAFLEVDLPYMILRLRQGIGRLIRTSEDEGVISIFLHTDEQPQVIEAVKKALPVVGEVLQ